MSTVALDLSPRDDTPARPRPGADTLALIGRCLRRSTRQVDTVILGVALPVLLLLMFVFVFGGAIESGMEYVDFVVPGIVILTAGYGAASAAVDVANDRTNGIVDRFRSMPIRSTGVLTGHVVASLVRNAVATALVLVIASFIGFDAVASPLAWAGAMGVVLLYVLAITWVSVALGLLASGAEAASGFTFAILFIPYVSSAFVPLDTMPAVLETIGRWNPVTPVADVVRGLLLGTDVAGSTVWAALAWSVGLLLAGWLAAAVIFRRRA